MADTRKELVDELRKKPNSLDRARIIKLALAGEFHDFKNKKYATPKVVLVQLLKRAGYDNIIEQVMDGFYDEKADAEDDAAMKKSFGDDCIWDALFAKKS